MRNAIPLVLGFLVCLPALAGASQGQEMPADATAQIAAAVSPAPEDQRDGATVLGYSADGRLIRLREGTGQLICLGDAPGDERFHVACYHRDLEPFMARGRELRAQGKSRGEIQELRQAEIEKGALAMPERPTALYSMTAPLDQVDLATATVQGGNRVFVVYIPYATEASTGLPPTPTVPGGPWIMSAGTPWAHIMIVQSISEGAAP